MSMRMEATSMWRHAAGILSDFARKGRLGSSSTAALGRYTGARI